MANYKYLTDFLNDLRAMPCEDDLIYEAGIGRLKQDYAISRMNDIYGKNNWSIREVKNELQKNPRNNTAVNICVVTVEYTHPFSGNICSIKGSAPMNFTADESVMQSAFLSAISQLGTTFGANLPARPTALLAEIPVPAHHAMAAVV